jgi:hypothetical protein
MAKKVKNSGDVKNEPAKSRPAYGHTYHRSEWGAPKPQDQHADEIARFIAEKGVTKIPPKFLLPSVHAKPDEKDVAARLATVPAPEKRSRAEMKQESFRRAAHARRRQAAQERSA